MLEINADRLTMIEIGRYAAKASAFDVTPEEVPSSLTVTFAPRAGAVGPLPGFTLALRLKNVTARRAWYVEAGPRVYNFRLALKF